MNGKAFSHSIGTIMTLDILCRQSDYDSGWLSYGYRRCGKPYQEMDVI